MKRNSISSELLDKYLNGTCSPEELGEVEKWYQSFQETSDIDQIFPDTKTESYSRSVFKKIRSQIKLRESASKQRPTMHLFRQWHWYLAASIVLGIGLTFFSRNVPIPAKIEISEVVENPTPYLENNTDQILFRQLPDNSKVWLNPGSRITYANDFGVDIREITLEGEAFFDVSRNTEKPFIIHTGKMTTEVLGTSFNVQANKDSKHFEVSVVTGTVAVSGPEGKKIISAKQQVQFDCVSGALNDLKRANTAPFHIWEPVTINFDWVPVKDVTNTLEQMFAVHVEFENEAIKNCFLRADFTNLRLPVIMDLLCQSIGATYTINNGTIRLYGAGCE
jgi:transmembrane sensor